MTYCRVTPFGTRSIKEGEPNAVSKRLVRSAKGSVTGISYADPKKHLKVTPQLILDSPLVGIVKLKTIKHIHIHKSTTFAFR